MHSRLYKLDFGRFINFRRFSHRTHKHTNCTHIKRFDIAQVDGYTAHLRKEWSRRRRHRVIRCWSLLLYCSHPNPTPSTDWPPTQYIFNRIPLYVVLAVAHTREDDVIRDQVLDILIAMLLLLLPIQVSGKTNKR